MAFQEIYSTTYNNVLITIFKDINKYDKFKYDIIHVGEFKIKIDFKHKLTNSEVKDFINSIPLDIKDDLNLKIKRSVVTLELYEVLVNKIFTSDTLIKEILQDLPTALFNMKEPNDYNNIAAYAIFGLHFFRI